VPCSPCPLSLFSTFSTLRQVSILLQNTMVRSAFCMQFRIVSGFYVRMTLRESCMWMKQEQAVYSVPCQQ
jgi:hypothetical protein